MAHKGDTSVVTGEGTVSADTAVEAKEVAEVKVHSQELKLFLNYAEFLSQKCGDKSDWDSVKCKDFSAVRGKMASLFDDFSDEEKIIASEVCDPTDWDDYSNLLKVK